MKNASKLEKNEAMSHAEKINYLKQSLLWRQIMRTKDRLENILANNKLRKITDITRASIEDVMKLEKMGDQLTYEVVMALYGMEKLIANGLARGEDPELIKSWIETITMRNDPKYIFQIATILRDIFRSVEMVETEENEQKALL